MFNDGVHARRCDKVGFAQGQRGFYHPSKGIEYPDRIGAPGPANGLRAGYVCNSFSELRIAHGEVLDTVVKTAVSAGAGGHAAACAMAFFKYADLMACLYERAGGGDAGHAGAYDSNCFHGLTLHCCGRLRRAGLSQ